MAECKEVHFFDQNYEKGISWYEEIFKGRTEKAIGEATPAYLYFEHIPQLIYGHMPHVKLILSLRNPVERAYSHYMNLIAKARKGDPNYGISFEKKIAVTPRLITEGLYVDKLERYFSLFPRENFLIVLYDDLKKDPSLFLQSVYSFLGVDHQFESPLMDNRINAAQTKLGKNRLLYLAYRASMSLGWYKIGKGFDRINRSELPCMSVKTKKMLLDSYYDAEISKLEKILGRDLSEWKRI